MLYGEGIRLRAIEREDIPAFLRWLNDPEVREFLMVFAPMSRAEEERWFEGRSDRNDEYFFAIEVPSGDGWVHIGNTVLHAIDWRNRTAGFAIMIGEKDYWDQGHGTAVARTMLRFAFGELNLHRVELEVFDNNPRAKRSYEKAGFQVEGMRRQAHFRSGRYQDVHLMAILSDEFQGLQEVSAA